MPPTKPLLALVAAVICFTNAILLGNWQTRRAESKLALQGAAEAAAKLAPIEIVPTRDALRTVTDAVPRRVTVKGAFDAAGTVYLDNRTLNGVAGFYVITPLVIADGLPVVLVDRGWTARDTRDRTRVDAPPAPGKVGFTGLAVARPGELFELGSTPERQVPGIWQNLDYAAYEKATGREVARFVIRQAGDAAASPADGLRREWPATGSGAERNRGYAFQWYSLAGLIAVLAVYFCWKAWRERDSKR